MPGPTGRDQLTANRAQPDTARAIDALAAVADPVDELLRGFLAERQDELARLDPALGPVGRAVADLVTTGGKRLRPAFVYWGHRATGAEHDPAIFGPAGAVELLHTFALIHDDIMDRSAQRRGRSAVHADLAQQHAREGLTGDRDWFGVGGGILAGDLAFVWADQLLDGSELGFEPLGRARRVFTALRIEVMAGQYLDLRLAGLPDAGEEDARRIALLKSGRYTVTRPLQLGAAIGGADELLDASLQAYGDAIGLAFQLRDDVLGLFGDSEDTGKGTLEDLREGKRTVLMLRAMELAGATERGVLAGLLGDPELDERGADRAREIVKDSGALAAVERLLLAQRDEARRALTAVPEPARSALSALADLAVERMA